MTTATRKQFIKRCRELGVLALHVKGVRISVDAPLGKRFASFSEHSHTINLRGWTVAEAYAEMLDYLHRGLEPCDDPDCEQCVHERWTFQQIAALYGGTQLSPDPEAQT